MLPIEKKRYAVYRTDVLRREVLRERFLLASFDTEGEAVAFAERQIDRSLKYHYRQRPGVSGTQLYSRWIDFADGLFIPGSWFSAKEYARMRAREVALELNEGPMGAGP